MISKQNQKTTNSKLDSNAKTTTTSTKTALTSTKGNQVSTGNRATSLTTKNSTTSKVGTKEVNSICNFI